MNWYALVKRYFDAGLYTGEQVQVFVTAKKSLSNKLQRLQPTPNSRRFYFALGSDPGAIYIEQ